MGHAGPGENAQLFSRRSCCSLPETFVAALAEPLGAALLGRLGQAGPDDQHVVPAGRKCLEPSAPELTQPALDPVPCNRSRDRLLRHREPEPRLAAFLAREPVERQEAGRNRASASVAGSEVPRSPEAA